MAETQGGQPTRVAILLTPDFGLTSFTCIVETLRSANALRGQALYAWQVLGMTAEPATSTAGVSIVPDGVAGPDHGFDMVFVPAAGNPAAYDNEAAFAWLRRLHRHGALVAGVSGGAFLLARAGLLRRRRFTIHWEHFQPLLEAFPELQPAMTLYEIDRGIATSAGGIATFDLMQTLIGERHGADLAARVGDWLLHTQPREGGQVQRVDVRQRFGISHGGLGRVLAFMEDNSTLPLGVDELARRARLSPRHLERLFREKLGTSIHQHLNAIRLAQARVMLRQTSLPVAGVAAAIGYASASHFARLYRARFGHSPKAERGGR